jgi:hypothetical protein
LDFHLKKSSSRKQADLRDVFIKAPKCFCTSTVVVSPDPLSPAPSTSTLKTQETQRRRLMKEIPKWNISVINCTTQV